MSHTRAPLSSRTSRTIKFKSSDLYMCKMFGSWVQFTDQRGVLHSTPTRYAPEKQPSNVPLGICANYGCCGIQVMIRASTLYHNGVAGRAPLLASSPKFACRPVHDCEVAFASLPRHPYMKCISRRMPARIIVILALPCSITLRTTKVECACQNHWS